MRRRERPADPSEVPANLIRFTIADWVAESEAPPATWQGSPWMWRRIQAWKRYLDARRAWCAETGRNYAETFRPEWFRWRP